MERDIEFLADFADFLHGLNHADLVVDHHDRNQARIGPNRRPELLEVHEAIRADREVRDLKTLLLEMATGVEYALVLGLGGDHVALLLLVEVHDALDGDVVALGGAGGEDDLLRRADEIGHLGARGLRRLVRLPPVHVGPGVRVSVLGHIKGQHGVENPRVHRRRGLHIQIERSPGDSHPFYRDPIWVLKGFRRRSNCGRRGGGIGPYRREDRGGSLQGLAEI
ncbi:LOW QUALITY PROTEIN: hypothetical protein PanWU01x14_334680 [Parasponia andersonii]|uniref:Uncharacterized protein n=1 Tax=Parasponia andersonii TaxID=3476 RepID=A0A2P5AGF7_PARAD|nr:LOW QUALITY PROTEIN: hypothetical protein PanWU01x14_334680 [Parasponia andersonii]